MVNQVKTQDAKTAAIRIAGEQRIVKYEFDLNGYSAKWEDKDNWYVFVQSVNKMHWTELKPEFLISAESEVKWHEHKLRDSSGEIQSPFCFNCGRASQFGVYCTTDCQVQHTGE